MRRRRVALGAFLVALAVASSLYVALGLEAYGQYQTVYGEYALVCDGLFAWNPPSDLFLGMYPNQSMLTALRVRSSTPAMATIALSIPGFTGTQTLEAQSDSTFQSLTFKPPLLRPAASAPLAPASKARVAIQVTAQISGHGSCQFSAPVTVYSREWVQWRNAETGADDTSYIAGWVTPQATVISDLIGKASDELHNHPERYDATPALYGYDQGQATPNQVSDQVDALFDTLQETYHLRYSSDNEPYTPDALQVVRTPREVLANQQPVGMCVETSVILAAAVERIGMRPYIVFTDNHAYLGVALTDSPGARIQYWETSDLNGAALGAQANAHGNAEYSSDSTSKAIKIVVDVTQQRALGINPIE